MARQSKSDREVVEEAQKRFKACEDWESTARSNFKSDTLFANGDAYNNNQWPNDVLLGRQRAGQPRPCLTFNKVGQHNKHIVNAARQNQMGIKVNATGFGATSEAAEAIEGLIRHIEYQSNAQQNAYLAAIKPQVEGGIGWVHVVTDYAPGDTFDQEIYLRSVPDALSVWSDADCLEPDHSDMRWGMVGLDMPRKEFEAKYPDFKGLTGTSPMTGDRPDYERSWSTSDKVRVMRYYRRNETNDTLWAIPPGVVIAGPLDEDGNSVPDPLTGQPAAPREIPPGIVRQSEMPDEVLAVAKEMGFQSRPITGHEVEWFLIAGSEIVEQGDTVFEHIPLVPFLGEEVVIDGKLDRKGQTRALIDAQRMYNYSASEYTAVVGLQAKAPWIGPARAFEGYENEWAQANTSTAAYLPYNDIDLDTGATIGAPERVQPPITPMAAVQGMSTAEHQMQMVSGQYDAEMGAQSNERTGTAIQQRQRQGETATYHFTDAQGAALRLLGKIVVSALPKVYDVQRAVQILGADGSRKGVVIDPSLPTAHANVPPPGSTDPDHEDAIMAINPTIGRYDVEADVGPAYGTRRQEAFNAIQQVLVAAPALVEKAGDLLFKAADFPLADEIAQRLAPASADPNLAQAQQAIQHLQQQLAAATAQLKNKQSDQALDVARLQHDRVDDVMRADLDRYKAETDRLSAIGSIDPAMLLPLVQQVVRDALATQLGNGPSPDQGTPPTPPPMAGGVPAVPPRPPAPPLSGGAAAPVPSSQPMTTPMPLPQPAAIPRLPTTNPPGGLVRGPVPTPGAVQ